MGFLDWIFGEDDREYRKRIFLSFAIEDSIYRGYLKEQARCDKSPFDFIDMSAKHPWKQSEWKKKCRTKMKRSHGVIVLLSHNTMSASVAKWEIKCAREQRKP